MELSATVRCPECLRSVHADYRCCPLCLAFLRDPGLPDRERWRPAAQPPFSVLAGLRLERLHAGADPVYLDGDGLIDAVVEIDPRSSRCTDPSGPLLFTLDPYEPVLGGWTAFAPTGVALATFLPADGGAVDVRDGTSAPVARLDGFSGGFVLRETGGGFLAQLQRSTYRLGDVHERSWWFVQVAPPSLHLPALAYAALLLACRVILGAPTTPVAEDR